MFLFTLCLCVAICPVNLVLVLQILYVHLVFVFHILSPHLVFDSPLFMSTWC